MTENEMNENMEETIETTEVAEETVEQVAPETETETETVEVEAEETVEEAEQAEDASNGFDEDMFDKVQRAARLLRARRAVMGREAEARAARMEDLKRALKLLELKPKMEQKEMADLLGMRLRELDALLAEAEAADIVARVEPADEPDMRKVVVYTSEDAVTRVGILAKKQDTLVPSLTDEEAEQLLEMLSKIIDPLTAMGLDNDDERGGRGGFDRGGRGGDRGPRRDDRGGRGGFDRGGRGGDRGPRRDFDRGGDRGPRRDDRGPRRDFDRGPRRDDRGGRGGFGGNRGGFGGGRGGDRGGRGGFGGGRY